MRIITADDLRRIFTFRALIEALRVAFVADIITPPRHHHTMKRPGEPDATLLLMPAWTGAAGNDAGPARLGVKIASVYPANAGRGLPSVSATYMLMDGATGAPLAMIDGSALTLWRTAAASALAATYLAREDASRLVMVGAGALSTYLIEAHASIRPLEKVSIWNRSPPRAEERAAELKGRPFTVEVVSDLEAAVRAADIVSCATMSGEPLVHGVWLKSGAHLDLVGAYTPTMREADDEAVRRARIYVDTRAGALAEAGDILLPMQSGIVAESGICGDLFELCRGKARGRGSPEEITLFKSVGTAIEDLAAASLALDG